MERLFSVARKWLKIQKFWSQVLKRDREVLTSMFCRHCSSLIYLTINLNSCVRQNQISIYDSDNYKKDNIALVKQFESFFVNTKLPNVIVVFRFRAEKANWWRSSLNYDSGLKFLQAFLKWYLWFLNRFRLLSKNCRVFCEAIWRNKTPRSLSSSCFEILQGNLWFFNWFHLLSKKLLWLLWCYMKEQGKEISIQLYIWLRDSPRDSPG